MNEKDDLFHETIRVFERCLALSETENLTVTIVIRKILILTKKAFSHTSLGEYIQAKVTIEEVR